MKTKIIALIGAASLTIWVLPVNAASPSDNDNLQRDRDAAHSQELTSFGDLRRANQIIGADIKDEQGQKFGKIKDLGLDLQNGRVAEVIVATGGSMGMKERYAAIPPQSLTCVNPREYRLKADRDLVLNAPEFQLSHWNESTANELVWSAYQRFGAEAYFAHEQPAPKPDPYQRGQVTHYYSFNGENALPRLTCVMRASKLMDSDAWSLDGKKLAKVDNFVIDLPDGRLVEVILAYGGFLGMDHDLCAVPPQAFQLSKDNTALGLNTTRDMLKTAPHFKANEWDRVSESDNIQMVYTYYHINPYFVMRDIGHENGGQNVRSRNENPPSTTEQSNQNDLDITGRIHRAIINDDSLSADARDVKVVTSDGKVTLVGPVTTPEEKVKIGKLAARIVSPDSVDNQLEVHPLPLSTSPSTPPTVIPPAAP